MGDELGTRGRRLWSVGLVLLIGAAGCATSAAEKDKAEAGPGERTQQVVQRILPGEANATHAAPAESALNSAGGLAPVVSTREARSTHRAEAISSKHLEAELNRLEAELGR